MLLLHYYKLFNSVSFWALLSCISHVLTCPHVHPLLALGNLINFCWGFLWIIKSYLMSTFLEIKNVTISSCSLLWFSCLMLIGSENTLSSVICILSLSRVVFKMQDLVCLGVLWTFLHSMPTGISLLNTQGFDSLCFVYRCVSGRFSVGGPHCSIENSISHLPSSFLSRFYSSISSLCLVHFSFFMSISLLSMKFGVHCVLSYICFPDAYLNGESGLGS